MNDERSWSLSRSLRRGLVMGLTGVVVVSFGVSAWFLWRGTERELSALLVEEVDEVGVLFPERPAEPSAWDGILEELREHHPLNDIGLRVWAPEGGAPLIESGPLELLAPDFPARSPLGEIVSRPGHLRSLAREMEDGFVVAIVLDGDAQYALLRSFLGVAALVILLATGVAFLGGTIYCRRADSLLRQVAERARSVRGPDDVLDVAVPGAPEEIKQISEALEEMHANVRQEAARARLLIAGLAHELRSPIQNLMGSTEVALLEPATPRALREMLERHLDELHELGDAVHNLVSLCAPGHARADAAVETFDLGDEVELRLARERALARRRGVRLALERRGDLSLAGDREEVLRAVRNLTANAVQWSPDGGAVRVLLEGEDRCVRIVIDDKGPGVPPDLRERIFEPFVRGPVVAGRRAGYGLGLALARAAAVAHGGVLAVSDAPGGGARFELSLPRRAQESSSVRSVARGKITPSGESTAAKRRVV